MTSTKDIPTRVNCTIGHIGRLILDKCKTDLVILADDVNRRCTKLVKSADKGDIYDTDTAGVLIRSDRLTDIALSISNGVMQSLVNEFGDSVDAAIVDQARLNMRTLPKTGIYIRAYDSAKCRWMNCDIAEVTRESLISWMRKDGGENPIAENVVLALLSHPVSCWASEPVSW